jgi:Dolichyl-phosphate-mannose-protein mannosyltransferase
MQRLERFSTSVSSQFRKPFFGLSAFALTVIFFAFVKFAIHMLTAQNFGYYCDELYTIDLSKHLAFGYVDLPPLVPALVALTRALLGESLLAIHFVPALAGAATLVFVCLITREFGGKLFATAVSALGYLISGFIWMNTFFGYDSIDQLWLAIFLFLLVRFIKTGNQKLWIGLGLMAGLAVMTKTTILYYGPGFLIALLISKYRAHLLTRWPWLGAGLCLVIVAPYIAWEFANRWPTLEYWRNYSEFLYRATPLEYFIAEFVSVNPVVFPIIVAGLYRIFRRFGDTNYSFIGILFLIATVLLFTLHARYHMLAALFNPLIAAGSVFFEEALSRIDLSKIQWRKGIQTAAIAVLVVGGVIALPSGVPMLPPDQMKQYVKVFGFYHQAAKLDKNSPPEFPLSYGYRNGWDSLVKTVADVYHGLPPEEQAKVGGILTDWYGPAGAIDLLGPQYGLPHAFSGHMNYYLWGPGDSPWDVMIVISWSTGRYGMAFSNCQKAGSISSEVSGPGINGESVYVCRNPTKPVKDIWPYMKYYH